MFATHYQRRLQVLAHLRQSSRSKVACHVLAQSEHILLPAQPCEVAAIEVRGVVADLAGVDFVMINPTTSIFELGLDSIDAIKLSSRLKSHRIDLSVSSIMKLQTILKISETFSTPSISPEVNLQVSLTRIQEEITNSLERTGKLPADVVKVLPLTALQESMVAEMIASGYQHYYGVEVFEVTEGTNFSKLLTSWKAVIDNHDILRKAPKVDKIAFAVSSDTA